MSMYIGDIETDGLLEELTKLHCFVIKKYKKDVWVIACEFDTLEKSFIENLNSKYTIEWIHPHQISEALEENVTALVIHNSFGFDWEALLKLGLIDSYDYDSVNGRTLRTIDSLSMSRCLNPDRQLPSNCPSKQYNTVTGKFDNVGPHGLAAWGYRVANKKPQVDDWRNQPLDVYINRCIEDTIINEGALSEMIEESLDVAISGKWKEPLSINNKADFLMNKQERDGILIDVDAAIKLVERIDNWMKDIEDDVEPQLPEREIPKSKRPNFPASPFSDSGEISHHGYRWLERLGYTLNEEYFNKVKIPAKPFKGNGELSKTGITFCDSMGWSGDNGELRTKIQSLREEQEEFLPVIGGEQTNIQSMEDLKSKKMPKMTETMRLSMQDDIKKYLVAEEGWEPTIWRAKDATKDSKKKERTEEEVLEVLKEYIESVLVSPYKKFIYEELGINFEKGSKPALLRKLKKKARFLITSPQYKDERKELCPNLNILKGDLAREIVTWLSLRNRRSVLKGTNEKKKTGWLNEPRLEVDGRIGQGFSGVTNTNRYKHVKIVNLPKASKEVLLGYEMRSLLIAPDDYVILGYDGSNLEQFVAASYAYKFDDGEYARQLEGDAHTTNAIAYTKAAGRDVSRSEGKNITYGVLYGAQKSKVSKMLGISVEAAQRVIDAFWDTNYGLKELKERLEEYWKSTGKKYILGIDGRKIFTRSQHSLVNALFQSCGSLIMFHSGNLMYDMLKEEGLIDKGVTRLAFVHDEYQYQVPKRLVKTKSFKSKEEAENFIDPSGKLWSNVKEVNGKWYRFYCRVGELGDISLRKAGEHFNMALPFSAAYDIGKNFAETH